MAFSHWVVHDIYKPWNSLEKHWNSITKTPGDSEISFVVKDKKWEADQRNISVVKHRGLSDQVTVDSMLFLKRSYWPCRKILASSLLPHIFEVFRVFTSIYCNRVTFVFETIIRALHILNTLQKKWYRMKMLIFLKIFNNLDIYDGNSEVAIDGIRLKMKTEEE